MASVAQVFQTCADQSARNAPSVSKRRLIVALAKLHMAQQDEFPYQVWDALTHLLPSKKHVASAEAVVKLLDSYMAFVTNENDKRYSEQLAEMGHMLAQFVIEKVIVHCRAQNSGVRFRSVEILATLINYLVQIDDFMFSIIRTTLLERIKDKDSAIRRCAVTALCKLQNTGVDEDDRAVRELLIKIMRFEPKAEIRRVTVFNIDINSETFPYIVERLLDKDAKCRLVTLKKIYMNVESPLDLPMEERENIIYHGLSDRDVSVRKAAVQLLEKWCMTCGGALPFLRALNVYRSKAAELVASACIMGNPTQKINAQDIFAEFDPASVLYLRVATEYFHENNMDDSLETAMPSLIEHVHTIKSLLAIQPTNEVEADNISFCTTQLLHIAEFQDFADEVGRREFIDLIYSTVANMNCNPDQFTKLVGLVSKIFTTQKEYIANVEGLLAVVLQSGMENEDNTTVFLQCMHFIRCILLSDIGLLRGSTLLTDLVEKFIMIALESDLDELNMVGSECLALASFVDKKTAESHKQYFVDLATDKTRDERPAAYMLSMQYLFDSVVLRGTSFLSEDKVIDLLESCFNSQNEVVMSLATEASAKLILMKRITPDGAFATKMHERMAAAHKQSSAE